MINIAKIQYRLIVFTEDKKQYNIKNIVENLGWEENKKELATRITFSLADKKLGSEFLSTVLKPGCLVGIFATDEETDKEVARGTIVEWNSICSNSKKQLKVKCYDELFNLQKSQDNIYYSDGIGTKSAILQIFDSWKIPVEKYEGPNITHGKLVYKSQYLSDVILDILDDAVKKGGEKCIIRASKGKVSILPFGCNKPVYCFEEDNTKVVNNSLSTSEMITRVKIVGQEDDGKSSVEATLNGKTEYGIRQKIMIREKDKSLEEAQSDARQTLDEKGDIQEEITVEGPDVPFIRKGDLIHVNAGTLNGYYFVESIRHSVETAEMSMDIRKAKDFSEEKEYDVGDIVYFKGGTHYFSSYPSSPGYPAKAGKAKITEKNGAGKAHPWHLIHADSESDVYGWVNDGDFE